MHKLQHRLLMKEMGKDEEARLTASATRNGHKTVVDVLGDGKGEVETKQI